MINPFPLDMEFKKCRNAVIRRGIVVMLAWIPVDKIYWPIIFADYVDLRYYVDNGITLSQNCHDLHGKGSFHYIYGTADNTQEQLEEYIRIKLEDKEQLSVIIRLDHYKAYNLIISK